MSEPLVGKFKIELAWKEFSMSLTDVNAWMIANAGSAYCGTQAHSVFEIWFTDVPSQEIQDQVVAYWDSITPESAEAVAYVSGDTIKAAAVSAKASAHAKLAALGLSQSEIEAL